MSRSPRRRSGRQSKQTTSLRSVSKPIHTDDRSPGLEALETRLLLSASLYAQDDLQLEGLSTSLGGDAIFMPASSSQAEVLAALVSTPSGFTAVGQQPDGALTGKIVYVSGGHGYVSNNLGDGSWGTQRGETNEIVEDMNNQDQLTYTVEQLWNAGATVVPLRPVGHQTNEVVLDNDDTEVTYSGTWSNSGSSIFYGSSGDTPYRYSNTALSESATATYTPNIPEAGVYPVYTWVRHGSDRTEQLYQVNHSGGTTEVTVDHSKVGNGWVYLGSYHMDAGTSSSVVISNEAGTTGKVVIADAIRFGNGMGDINRGGGISGHSREDESTLYWIEAQAGQGTPSSTWRTSSSDATANVSAPIRWAKNMNREAGGTMTDRVYVGLHSNATDGTARGTIGLYRSVSSARTPNQIALANALAAEVNDDLVSLNGDFEHNWYNRAGHTLGGVYGEISNSIINNEFDATILETMFHDNALDAELIRDPKVREAVAQATTQGLIKYFNGVDSGATSLDYAPERVTDLRAESNGNGTIALNWTAPTASSGLGDAPTGFMVYRSLNGRGFDGGTYVSGGTTSSYTVTGLDSANGTHYFRVAAVNAGGESQKSAVVASTPLNSVSTVLIVNGFDRNDRGLNVRQSYGAGTIDRTRSLFQNSFDYAIQVGEAVEAYSTSLGIDTVQNEAVINGDVDLDDYDTVIWIVGEESSADDTFNATEQSLVTSFVSGGGNLFVSGPEIGWDLDNLNNGRTFFNNTLGADYVADDANTHSATGVTGSIFEGISLTFDDGTLYYDTEFPDIISPLGASVKALNYTGGSSGAAIQRTGTGGAGSVVMLAFPFETIVDETDRNDVMAAALDFFGTMGSVAPADPTGLATTAYDGSVQLDWSDNTEMDLAGYNVYRSTSSGGAYTQINGSLVTDSQFTDTTATNSTTYYYVVTAENDASTESGNSTEASATPIATLTTILDNDDGTPGFSTTGGWTTSGSSGYDGGSYLFAATGASATATWTADLPVGGEAEVFAQFRASANRASSAEFVVNHAGGSTTVYVNQTLNNLTWVSLGTFTFNAGNSTVVLDAAASTGGDVVIADAVRFILDVPSAAPSVPTGVGAVALNAAVGLEWGGNGEPDLAGYNVYQSSTSGGTFTKLNSSLLTSTTYTDHTASNGTASYYVIRAVDTFGNESGSSSEVSATPSSSVEFIIDNDNGSPGYTETGSWTTSGSSGYNGGGYRFGYAGAASTATWTQDLAAANYEVFVQYRASTNRTTATKFTVNHAGGASTVSVDQTANNLVWVSLGTFGFNAGDATVVLDAATSTGGAVVIADTVRFVPQAQQQGGQLALQPQQQQTQQTQQQQRQQQQTQQQRQQRQQSTQQSAQRSTSATGNRAAAIASFMSRLNGRQTGPSFGQPLLMLWEDGAGTDSV